MMVDQFDETYFTDQPAYFENLILKAITLSTLRKELPSTSTSCIVPLIKARQLYDAHHPSSKPNSSTSEWDTIMAAPARQVNVLEDENDEFMKSLQAVARKLTVWTDTIYSIIYIQYIAM